MKLEEKVIQQLQEDLKKCKTMDDLLGKDGAIKKLIKNAVEQMLQCEMTEHHTFCPTIGRRSSSLTSAWQHGHAFLGPRPGPQNHGREVAGKWR